MSWIAGQLETTFYEAIKQSAHEVIKDADDWRAINKIEQTAKREIEDRQKAFDEENDQRMDAEILRLSLEGHRFDINGPGGAQGGETIEQRARRSVNNAHQDDLNRIEEDRSNALLSILETARARQGQRLEPAQGRAREAFDQVNDRRKTLDRRIPSRQR